MGSNKVAPLIGIKLKETTMFLNIVGFFIFNFSEIQMESSLVLWMNGRNPNDFNIIVDITKLWKEKKESTLFFPNFIRWSSSFINSLHLKNKGEQRFKEENKEVFRGFKKNIAIILSWWSSKRFLGSNYQWVTDFW